MKISSSQVPTHFNSQSRKVVIELQDIYSKKKKNCKISAIKLTEILLRE